MPDPLLSAFPPPLLCLILCGDGRLPVAYGPLHRYDGAMCAWEPLTGFALALDQRGRDPLLDLDGYLLPLKHWRPRLAACAVWLLTGDVLHASVDLYGPDLLVLSAWRGGYCAPEVWSWRVDGEPCSAAVQLPTLAEYLRDHDPAVALLLALFDAPEIRAKVEVRNE